VVDEFPVLFEGDLTATVAEDHAPGASTGERVSSVGINRFPVSRSTVSSSNR
jgi:hypothetical protein